MTVLFPNTGIHFLPLHYAVRWKPDKDNIAPEFGLDWEYIVELIRGEWTPIQYDQFDRDYARIYWRPEIHTVGEEDLQFLRPIVAIDTTLGKKEEGHLERFDIGRTFYSGDASALVNQGRLVREWLKVMHNRKRDYFTVKEWHEYDPLHHYERFLIAIQEDLRKTSQDQRYLTLLLDTSLTSKDASNVAGEFEFRPSDDETDLDVNVYLDLGNSRSTCVFYEDTSLARRFGEAVFPLRLYNYQDFLRGGRPLQDIQDDPVFMSRLEFRPSPFHDVNTHTRSTTFAWPSMVALGREAHELATANNPNSTTTGISGPKRYLWDDALFDGSWYFSTGQKNQLIEGPTLKYFSKTDKDEPYDGGLDRPTNPNYPRRALTTFFVLEILQQVLRLANSPEHRQGNHTLRRRILRRLVVTYPSGIPQWMKERLKRQAEKAAYIISKELNIPPITVELGMDEASAAQIVFVESQLQRYQRTPGAFMPGIVLANDKNVFRVASVDIGGGTTDMMVASYDMENYVDTHKLYGRCLFQDSTSIGGDDLVKALIERIVIRALLDTKALTNEAQEVLFRGHGGLKARSLRVRFMNLILIPLAYHLLESLRKRVPTDKELSGTLVEIISRLQVGIQANTLNDLSRDAENLFDLQKKISVRLPDQAKVEKVLKDTQLVKQVLFDYAKMISLYAPSFVVLSGKLSALPLIQKRIAEYLPTSPDRIIALSTFQPGAWYPPDFVRRQCIDDPKTVVVTGVAVADIAQHAKLQEGCDVVMRRSEDSSINFVGPTNHNKLTFTEDEQIFGPDDEQSTRSLPITKPVILSYRNINSEPLPANPLYVVQLKEDVAPSDEDIPRVRLRRSSADRGQLEVESCSGAVFVAGQQEELCEDHIEIKQKTMIETNYYLDTGELENLDA
ncbi:MAG: hypothetical protein KatS3mg042_1375 [Rhodothermaceae bacterium]|nr:MAG: hypothetical protein KatS3mg042_1375 [Rhodothermaceae bacterium]